jgi:hypothetical protein
VGEFEEDVKRLERGEIEFLTWEDVGVSAADT